MRSRIFDLFNGRPLCCSLEALFPFFSPLFSIEYHGWHWREVCRMKCSEECSVRRELWREESMEEEFDRVEKIQLKFEIGLDIVWIDRLTNCECTISQLTREKSEENERNLQSFYENKNRDEEKLTLRETQPIMKISLEFTHATSVRKTMKKVRIEHITLSICI